MQQPEGNPTDQGKRKIVTHDDFDGVVSAALCSLAEEIDTFLFTGPVSVLDMALGVDQGTIVCDLPHHPAAGMWFDHHVGNLEDYRLKGGDPESICGAFSPEKSCARVIYNHYAGKVEFPEFLQATVEEADIIDSFDYRDIDDWQRETPGKIIADTLRASFNNRGDRNRYLRHLIRRVRAVPLREILADREVEEKIRTYRDLVEKNRIMIERLASFLPEDTGQEIILLDTTGLKHAATLIKSLAFLTFPEAKAVLEVRSLFRQKRKTNDLGVSISLSPCLEVQSSQKDVGEIMRELNIGDGHRGAGAGRVSCRSKAEMLKQKEKLLHGIFSMWSRQGDERGEPSGNP